MPNGQGNFKGEFRTEKDHLGEILIPQEVLWGVQTARAQEVFHKLDFNPHPRLLEAIVQVKKACAQANLRGGRLHASLAKTIEQACNEILQGQFRDQFIVSPLAGAEAYCANVNEVIANRAARILGKEPGKYLLVHPDLHISMAQSANDVFPTAMRIAILLSLKDLERVLLDLERLLRRKSLEFDRVIKTGRTHLQDSLPITMGQEFNAYGSTIQRGYQRIRNAAASLHEVNLGGTFIGTGLGAETEFAPQAVQLLSLYTGLPLKIADDHCRISQSMADFLEVSSSLKQLAIDLIKIANDIRLLASGPSAGLSEIQLPGYGIRTAELLPDVLPYRVFPAVAELLCMVAYEVVGNDTACALAAQAGQLETNNMSPAICKSIFASLDSLSQALMIFNQHCISGITANSPRCREFLEASGAVSLAIASHLGQEVAANLTKEALTQDKSIKQLVSEKEIMPNELVEALLHHKALARFTRPGIIPSTTGDTTV
jgi:aspartate ammonia-lyase